MLMPFAMVPISVTLRIVELKRKIELLVEFPDRPLLPTHTLLVSVPELMLQPPPANGLVLELWA